MSDYLEKTHKLALKRFKQCVDYYAPIRKQAAEDLRFMAGKQWDEQINPNDGRIRLTVPLIQPFVRQIVNEIRQNMPSINISPMSGGADEDRAELQEGIIRAIELKSNASRAYERASWYAVVTGEGYITLDTDYVSPDSFNQEIKICVVDDPAKIYLDPDSEELDGSDAEFGFMIEDIPKEIFEMKFPKSKFAETQSSRLHVATPLWESDDSVRVARYFTREYSDVTLYLVTSNKGSNFVSKVPGEDIPEQFGEIFTTVQKRLAHEVKVDEYLMNGIEILEKTEWVGTHIPIIKVTGDRFFVEGKLVQQGAVRQAKDVQKQYNYHTSVQTELIDMAPKSSFVGATGQFANNPEKWADANVVNYGFLDYSPVSVEGQLVPAPSRISAMDGGLFQAAASSRMASLEDLKMVFGVQDASLGRNGNETSGVAILARQEQSGVSNYHYYDNLLASIASVGRQLIEMIPKIYDTERIVQIVKPSDEKGQIIINSDDERFDLSNAGEYSVNVTTGPAFGTRRQAAAESMMQLVGAYPQVFSSIGDILVSNMDWPDAKRIAQRLKASVPPEILAATGEDDESKMAPKEVVQKLQLQLSQQTQLMKKLDAENQELKIKSKISEDKTSLDLTKADMENEQKKAQLEYDRQVAQAEIQIKMMELNLKEREMALREQEIQIKTVLAAHGINETMGSAVKNSSIGNLEPGGEALDADIGGKF